MSRPGDMKRGTVTGVMLTHKDSSDTPLPHCNSKCLSETTVRHTDEELGHLEDDSVSADVRVIQNG